jgi:hypothetical protein
MAQDWRAVIAKYDRDVADGTIRFDGEDKFADSYPHQAEQDASLAEFVTDHVDN